MKKILITLLVLVASLTSFAATKDYHIGVVTTTVSQGEDAVRAAEQLVKTFGSSSNGGKISHIILPDNFMQEQETTISQIFSLSNDPKMKAIVVFEGIPGTVEAFRKIREKRKDILLITATPHEDPDMISSASDLVVGKDIVNRGYFTVKTSKDLGAKTFINMSFPRHMSNEFLSRKRDIMKVAAKDLGLEYVEITVPDPLSEVGVAGAQQYVLEQVPNLIKKYGKDTSFYATNNAQTEPLLKQVAKYGGIFVLPDSPSPTLGYPGAFGIKFTAEEKGNWPKIVAKIEKTVVAAGGSGRMGNWAWSMDFNVPIGLVYRAMEVIENGGKITDEKALMVAIEKATPGAKWAGTTYEDAKGVELSNMFMIYQDTYIFGKGYMGITKEKTPAKYSKIK